MAQKISYVIILPIDEIKVEYTPKFVMDRVREAYDKDGNRIEAFLKVSRNYPEITLIHNGIIINYRDFNERWIKFQRTECDLLFPNVGITFENNNLHFSGDAYSKNQFDVICDEIVRFLKREFYVVFDLNSVEVL